jgi:predicted nucleic acid-binding Zn ribbon protein
MWKKTFRLFFYLNVALLLFLVILILAAFFQYAAFVEMVFLDETAQIIRLIISIPLFALWIYCLTIWSKHDKSIKHLMLLFFLMSLYVPVFYYKAIKNSWV